MKYDYLIDGCMECGDSVLIVDAVIVFGEKDHEDHGQIVESDNPKPFGEEDELGFCVNCGIKHVTTACADYLGVDACMNDALEYEYASAEELADVKMRAANAVDFEDLKQAKID